MPLHEPASAPLPEPVAAVRVHEPVSATSPLDPMAGMAPFTEPAAAPRAEPKHAATPPPAPVPPTPPAASEADTEQNFSTNADPHVASRYRQAMAATIPVPEAAPLATMDPSQPGWPGMPLPSANGGSGLGRAVPGAYAPQPSYSAPGTPQLHHSGPQLHPGAPQFHPGAPRVHHPGTRQTYTGPAPTYSHAEQGNRTAWSAFGTGSLALLLAVLLTFFHAIGLWPTLLAVAAVVQGIIGAVRSRRARAGLWPSLLAVLFGLVAIGVMVATLLSSMFTVTWDERAAEREMTSTSNRNWHLNLMSVDCPAEPPMHEGATFACVGTDTGGRTYPIEVNVHANGVFTWMITA